MVKTSQEIAGWEEKVLGEIGSFSKGKGIRKDEVSTDGLPCIRYGEIYTMHDDFVREFSSFIAPSVALLSQKIKKGDLLFAGSGETAEEIGKCVAYLGDDEVYAGGDIVIFSPENADSRFLGYLMNSYHVAVQKTRLGQGDAVVHIGPRALAKIQIKIPSTTDEQSAIASILSDTDNLIHRLEKLIAKKQDIRQGSMQELLTGKKRLEGFNEKWKIKKISEIAFPSSEKNITAENLPVLTCSKYLGFMDSLSYFKNQVFSKNTSTYKLIKKNQIGYPANHVEE